MIPVFNLISCNSNLYPDILFVNNEQLNDYLGKEIYIDDDASKKYKVEQVKSFISLSTEVCTIKEDGGCQEFYGNLPLSWTVLSIKYNGVEYVSTPSTYTVNSGNAELLNCNGTDCVVIPISTPLLANNYGNLSEFINNLMDSYDLPVISYPCNYEFPWNGLDNDTSILFSLPYNSSFEIQINKSSGSGSGDTVIHTYGIDSFENPYYNFSGAFMYNSVVFNTEIDYGVDYLIDDITETICNCEVCDTTTYLLTPCRGGKTLVTTQEDFSTLINKVVKLPFNDNSCYTVTEKSCDNDDINHFIEYSGVYDNCTSCYDRSFSEDIDVIYGCGISEDEYCKNYSKISEKYYNEVINKRFKVKTCCNDFSIDDELDFRFFEKELINHCSPDLPEPIVFSCCIDTTTNCEPCVPCTQSSSIICPCVCEILSSSHLECRAYSFNVTNEMILDANGNDKESVNGVVFFGYYPCGGTVVKTVRYTELSTECENFTAVGQPLLGYFKDNVFISLDIECTL